ncbi:MAG: hypothetical protein QOF48_1762 [Verrucomicrobiota bacterium]
MHLCFDAGTLAKGKVYQAQRRVLSCSMGGTEVACKITAEVRGSNSPRYEVDVAIEELDAVLKIHGQCSCPMEYNCKHAAAVLFHLLEDPKRWFTDSTSPSTLLPDGLKVALDAQWTNWLTNVDITTASRMESGEFAFGTNSGPTEQLRYVLRARGGRIRIEFVAVRRLKSGEFGKPQNVAFSYLLQKDKPAIIPEADMELARKIFLAQAGLNTYEPQLEGAAGARVLPDILATGRCYWHGPGRVHSLLHPGPARPAVAAWQADALGQQRANFRITPPAEIVLPLAPPWYLDEAAGLCGPLQTDLPDAVALAWLSAPPIAPGSAAQISAELAKRSDALRLPTPQKIEVEEIAAVAPIPCLRLYAEKVASRISPYSYRWGHFEQEDEDEPINFAHLFFDYAGFAVPSSSKGRIIDGFSDGRLRRVIRDMAVEAKAEKQMRAAGLEPARDVYFDRRLGKLESEWTAEERDDWFEFVQNAVPKLRKKGWRVDMDESFRFRIAEPANWYTDATAEPGHDWFGVELGVEVDGQKLNLLPILLQLIQASPNEWSAEMLAQMPEDSFVLVPLADGRKLPFPVSRARAMLGVLLELMNPNALNATGKLRLNKLRVAELAGDAEWRWLGNAELQELSKRLKNFQGIHEVTPSPRLRATLRPYQQEGLNWLQFLREYELAGILADDMGLGKTVQALAHLLAEKESGRMDVPSLVIAPTSLMTNWRQEAEKFAPDLRILVLHGLDRKQHFERIQDHDLIITSYPLLARDQAVLLARQFHCLILDEAQFIKNPKTLYAQIACQLKARHHLCLTGTPMENHLGELWSLFHFLLPGFLSDETRFNSLFRRPIEKGRSDERRKLLARRVAPFILRRKKETVALELPPKTEIIQNVELTGAQRDLYESVRLAMHERVRAEVNSKGLSRAHIIILDALLKLRQICCHPQLLSLPSAQKVQESAKLDLLMDLLPEMLEEGRRILLFSQFTSMLAILQVELAKRKIPFVLLTGQTTDRATPVARFQNGEVPLFLISLKAGGTGLNLTAADTVIHYDPWWNPAVENQATDRAHRIGQDKNVFVYKLMTIGTVEEKIASLQARKKELVEGLLNEDRRENLKLTPDDLDVLFAPLK